ncbi:hypothetical protein [Sulfitobacter aestuariivivens]|uniref:Uncharacterized protein n=1 Tax=Sulfitobacter aestuariivivens TaxID=2766981 RepID=A0A927D2R7_9RHOB|nr:hypothetical protein [Sulfitobacter aestuariivivens]MBD3663934.1 hypothetical protein [Sulfitobacter aestuariivivens]
MKLTLSTALALVVATAASAGNSDRYNDLRFDTAIGHIGVTGFATDFAADTAAAPAPISSVRFSSQSRKSNSSGKGYAYDSPYGVGPNNDSR